MDFDNLKTKARAAVSKSMSEKMMVPTTTAADQLFVGAAGEEFLMDGGFNGASFGFGYDFDGGLHLGWT